MKALAYAIKKIMASNFPTGGVYLYLVDSASVLISIFTGYSLLWGHFNSHWLVQAILAYRSCKKQRERALFYVSITVHLRAAEENKLLTKFKGIVLLFVTWKREIHRNFKISVHSILIILA